MKIAIISRYLPTEINGGVPKQVHLSANKLVERGHEVTVFSLYDKPQDAKYKVYIVKLPYLLQKLTRYKKALGGIFFPIYLARKDFSSFDIIHAHGDSHFIFTRKPIVRTFHGSGLEEALHAESFLLSAYYLFIYPFEILSAIFADKRIAVSVNTRQYIPLIDKVIYNGIDLEKFRQGNGKSENPSILFVGRLHNRKRGRLLLEAFETIKKKINNAELWLVCDRHIVKDGVKTFVNLDDDELIHLYQQAHIFCLPSSYEGFGIPYAEAMACGTAVVATPNRGSCELLKGSRYGAMVQEKHLAEELSRLLSDDKGKNEFIAKGLLRAQDFSLEQMINSYEEIYQRLAKKEINLSISKRLFDFTLALTGLFLSLPLWFLFSYLIWLEDRGGIFYLQERVGLSGRPFMSIKFRSMKPFAERNTGPVQSKENDLRVTKIGRLLRVTAMDELPQLINILKGDMSFVGPRALRPLESDSADNRPKSVWDFTGFKERCRVRPGLTGVAQVLAPRDLARSEKIKYDLWYIANRSFLLDIKIIIFSFLITFRGRWESREEKCRAFRDMLRFVKEG